MTYLSGTKVVDSAGAIQNIVTLIEQAMTGAGWTLVETYSGWRIWKCPASINGVQDFYVMFSMVGGTLYFSQFEEYNPATHQYRRGMSTLSYTSVIPSAFWDSTTQSINGQTWSAIPAAGNSSSNYQMSSWNSAPTSQFDYVIRCGSKHLLFSITWSSATNNQSIGKWVGLFDTLIDTPANDPMPFAMFDIWGTNTPSGSASSSNSAPSGVTSRTPLPAADSSWYGINTIHSGLSPATGLPFSTASGGASTQFNALGGSNDVWRAPTEIGQKYIVHQARHMNDGRILSLRGRVPGIVSFGAGLGLYIGDEFVFNGATYAVVSYVPYAMGLAVDKEFAA